MILKDMQFDTRTIPHRVRRHELARKVIEKHLASLTDDANEAEVTTTVFSRSFEERHHSKSSDKE